MDFKKGERVGISKLLGRGGPLWRPGTITGPSPSPHWDYTIAYDDKHGKFLHATRSHVIKWTKYEASLRPPTGADRPLAALLGKTTARGRSAPPPAPRCPVSLPPHHPQPNLRSACGRLRSRLRFFAKDRSRPIFVSVAIR